MVEFSEEKNIYYHRQILQVVSYDLTKESYLLMFSIIVIV